MNIFYKTLLSVSLILTLGAFQAFAATGNGVATKYDVTTTKMELCTGPPSSETDVSCSGAVVLGEGNKIFDIASVAVGAEIGSYVGSSGLPIGTTFTHMKVTFLRKVTITGVVSSMSDSHTCDCRTESTSVSNSAKGNYKSLQAGVCDSADPEAQVMYMLDLVSSADNVQCLNAACTSTTATTYTRTALATLASAYSTHMYGKSMEEPAVDQLTMSAIYILEAPYTAGVVAPKIEVAFGTNGALYAGTTGGSTCYVDVFYPKVRITITD